jgi:hypothetical protein
MASAVQHVHPGMKITQSADHFLQIENERDKSDGPSTTHLVPSGPAAR